MKDEKRQRRKCKTIGCKVRTTNASGICAAHGGSAPRARGTGPRGIAKVAAEEKARRKQQRKLKRSGKRTGHR